MAGEANPTSLLRTKLHRPPVPGDHVHRPRLVERLIQRQKRPLTLVSAPAGYGKSVLISYWLETCDAPSAWLSLDEQDNDLRLFLSYFLAAVRTISPDAVSETMTLVNASTLPPLSALAGSLANELDSIEQDFILVLDDIHRIQEKSVHDLLSILLRHPARPMHLVLMGRKDPSLPIASLRARDQVTEVRLFDLRFATEETVAFLQTALGEPIEEATAATLTEKAEGWVTGLRLAVLAMRGHDDAVGKLLKLKGTTAYVMDYLIAEVLDAQSPVIRRSLLVTSILDRFNSALCETLSGLDYVPGEDEIDGDEFIAKLQNDNLFLIGLDTENHWFRYHHLFQELLQSQLKRQTSPEDIAALHSRAGEWFAENGLIDEALQHAIASNNIPYAAKLVEQHRYELMNREQWNRLERWLKMLPPETVEKNPMLLSARAYVSEYRGQVIEFMAYRDQAERLLSTLQPESFERKALQGEIAVLHAEQHLIFGDADRALENAKLGLQLVPPGALHIWSYAIGEKVLAYQMNGDIGRGLKIVTKILNEHASLPSISEARLMLWFCMAYWMEGELDGLKQPALRCLDIGEQHSLFESICFGRYFLGVMHYISNEFSEAERYLNPLVDDPFKSRPAYLVQSAFTLALIFTAKGRDDEASNIVESVIWHTLETNDSLSLATARAFQVELALRQGKVLEAQRLSEGATYDLLPPLWFLYVPQLTPIKLLLAQNIPESMEKALILLDPLDEYLRKTNRKTILIDVLALQALILNAQGKEPAAIERLSESLALAKPGGFIRNFVDLGPPMADLLRRPHKQNVAVDYVGKLLTAFGDDEPESKPDASDHDRPSPAHPPTSSPSHPTPESLVEPLTNRELDVLELLAQRLQTKEIAERLFISTETVKGHLKNIYQRLGVGNRREAAQKARDLGIL